MNILIVDDNVINRELLEAVLQAEGLTTCEAGNGHDAFTVLHAQAVDAIISDILMPKMDGYRFCLELRRQAKFAKTPLIFYSSTYTSAADERLGLQLGANAFLRKPAGAKEMLATLREVMKQNSGCPPPPLELPEELRMMEEYSEQLVAKLEKKNTELQERTGELRELSRNLLEVQEIEQRHLARELHDELGQNLSVLKINLEAIHCSVRPGGNQERTSECIELVNHLVQQVRGMALNLRPSILDDLGLVAAVRWYGEQHAKRTGLVVIIEGQEGGRRYAAPLETACFRVAQEAFTNILRHAHARHVRITIQETEGVLRLSVRDDGVGFDAAATRQRARHGASFGLIGMQERVSLLGGKIEVESAPGRGTDVRACFPLPGAPAAKTVPRAEQP